MSSWTPTKYETRNLAGYNHSLKQRGSLSVWLEAELTWKAEASGRWGVYKPSATRTFRPAWPLRFWSACQGALWAVYRRVIREINQRYDPLFDSIRHIDRKWRNNRIENDRAAMKRLLGYR